jgi:hypothetical protein
MYWQYFSWQKKAELPNPFYHESEVIFWNCRALGSKVLQSSASLVFQIKEIIKMHEQ